MGMTAGFLAVMLLSQWLWLEMRINISLALPLLTLAGMILAIYIQKSISAVPAVAAQVLGLLIFLWLFDFNFQAIRVLPAVWIREGFGLDFLSAPRINLMTAGLIFAGNTAFLFPSTKKNNPR
jgi:hypothetical protein